MKKKSKQGLIVERDLSPDSRCKREIQVKLSRPIHYQANILWGAIRLMDLDVNPFTEPTNMDQLKRYHV